VRVFTALIVIALLALASACDNTAAPATSSTASLSTAGTTPGSSSTSTSTAAAPSTSTTVALTGTDEEQIRATIDTYWAEWLLAGDPPDPDRPSFLAVLTGEQRQREVKNLQTKQALQQARRLPANSVFAHSVIRVTASGDTAVAIECVVDDTVVVDIADGHVRNDEVATSIFETHLIREDGIWRLSVSNTTKDQIGVHPCVE
jgi:hypothetical protein